MQSLEDRGRFGKSKEPKIRWINMAEASVHDPSPTFISTFIFY